MSQNIPGAPLVPGLEASGEEGVNLFTMAPMRVALVEDDPLLRKEIHYHLKQQGFLVFAVNSGRSLDDLLITEPIDALVLDLSLPGEDGISIARRMRVSIPSIGIIMLTARAAIPDRLKGYDAGADIYLSKPVAPEELTAALMSMYRRSRLMNKVAVSWVISLQDRSIVSPYSDEKAFLTNSEKTLLVGLTQASQYLLETEVICEMLSQRPDVDDIGKRALESLVSRLRKKLSALSPEGAEPALKAVWGVGYQLCIPIEIRP
ncbi:response regulator transcription factor [Zwartia panacis]|uniref:response regulator transcription factor n=1 Tax=Zwartia panacis TaxID=2683345 RepID=UPI0025B4A434|nr:response regulator transcription factor [Zwartia panacis]MDN4016584.1 response regulator transcription factor [Zwartia panacis]